jgi:hypothetical protein
MKKHGKASDLLDAHGGAAGPDLAPGQALQFHDFRASGERFGRGTHEREVLRTGQDELAGGVAVAIHLDLEVAEQPGRVLDLVHDQRRRMTAQEGSGVPLGLLGFARKIEGDELVSGEEAPHQAGLSGLTGAGEHDHRALPGTSQQ